jgi:hypothetical protein
MWRGNLLRCPIPKDSKTETVPIFKTDENRSINRPKTIFVIVSVLVFIKNRSVFKTVLKTMKTRLVLSVLKTRPIRINSFSDLVVWCVRLVVGTHCWMQVACHSPVYFSHS